jgi:hypothetical protein
MDTISELNPHPCSGYFQGDGKSENIIHVSSVQDLSRYRLKLLGTEKVRDREIESACYSGVKATVAARVLAKGRYGENKGPEGQSACLARKRNLKKSRRDFTGKRIPKT